MSSEWMKVMLDEIARKQAEAEEARAELERRGVQAPDATPSPGTPGPPRDAGNRGAQRK